MTVEQLAAYLEPIVKACPLWKGKNLQVTLIANPRAGGFTQKKLSRRHELILNDFSARARHQETHCIQWNFEIMTTEYPGHGSVFSRQIAQRALQNPETDYLIITAGGDGTSLEVQTALVKAAFGETVKPEEREKFFQTVTKRITVLRMPFGTGNDGADGSSLEYTLSLLWKPARFCLQRAVRVFYSGSGEENSAYSEGKKIDPYESLNTQPPWYAFNIASVGIDAYITHMTNKTKGLLPGNFYKLWIDIACLFYDFSFPSGQAHITALNAEGKVIKELDETILFCLLGVSGHRTYGSNQKILPDDRNVCLAKKMNLLQKLLAKEKFKSGSHTNLKTATLFNAEKLIISYKKNILTQLDGEVHLLGPQHFPLVFELTEPVIRVLFPEKEENYRGLVPV